MTGGPPQAVFGARKYLWGNVPAIDVIRMGQNEGVDFQGPINLLFAGKKPLLRLVPCIFQASRSPP